MDMDRRHFLFAAGVAALAPLAVAAARRWAPAAVAAAPALRPVALGTSARLCARCGAADHTALDGRCPAAREARTALQTASRREAGGARRAGA